MTELGFLIELLTEHKLSKLTKQRITERMKEVESGLAPRMGSVGTAHTVPRPSVLPANLPPQAPSTLAAMARHEDVHQEAAPVPPTQVAQTAATAAALQQRQQLINDAVNGQVAVKETSKMTVKSPRKW